MEQKEAERQYASLLIEAGKRLLATDLTIETWGNISVYSPETDHIYITPSGMPYDTLKEEDICILNTDGKQVGGARKPSIEYMLHVKIYQTRKDVHAVLHTHPLHSAVFAVLHQDIPVITDEMAQAIGDTVKCASYALPGSIELANNAANALAHSQACLLANHGAVCVGKDMKECFKVAAVLESSASIYQQASAIGNVTPIDKENVAWMRDFALHKYGQR